jgi:Ni/Co efflux regulator RcnB
MPSRRHLQFSQGSLVADLEEFDMSQRLRILSAALAAVLAFAAMPATIAHAQSDLASPQGLNSRFNADLSRSRSHDRDHRYGRRDGDRDHHRRDRSHRADRDRRDRYVSSPRGGTFTGNVSSYRDRGNGNYYYIDRRDTHRSRLESLEPLSPGPKVVNPASGNSACSDEGGVCVIRPQ